MTHWFRCKFTITICVVFMKPYVMICNHGNINASLQRNTTAGQMSTGTIFTRSMRIVSSKTATGSSRSSQSWPRSVALTMWVILRSLPHVTASRIVRSKNKVGKLQLRLTLMMTSQALLPLIAFLRWGGSSEKPVSSTLFCVEWHFTGNLFERFSWEKD